MLLSRPRQLVLLSAAALIAVAGAWFFLSRDTPKRVAVKVAGSLISGDSDEIWRYVPASEAREMGITKDQFKALIRDYVVPTFKKFGKPIQQVTRESETMSDQWGVTYTFRRPDGMLVYLGALGLPSNQGPKSHSLLSHVVMQTMMARHHLASDKNSYEWQTRAIKSDSALLDGIGIHGFVMEEANQSSFVTWDQRLLVCEERLSSHP